MSSTLIPINRLVPQGALNLPSVDLSLKGFNDPSESPGYLRVQLNDYCNERCTFCHNEGSEVLGRNIDEGVMWSAIDASIRLGKTKIRFTGGEPTLHPKFAEYVMALREIAPHADIGVTSNGTRLSRLPRELFEEGLDKLTVSLHSIDRQRYQEITGRDYLPQVLEGLQTVRSSGFSNVSLNTVVGRSNFHELEAVIQYAMANGFSVRVLDTLGDEQEHVPAETLKNEVDRVMDGENDGRVVVKPKLYHPKCNDCTSKPVCGEGDYLRLNVDGRLVPCLFRLDLEQTISPDADAETVLRQVALGFRRVKFDDL